MKIRGLRELKCKNNGSLRAKNHERRDHWELKIIQTRGLRELKIMKIWWSLGAKNHLEI
jgi:hypothetical protein